MAFDTQLSVLAASLAVPLGLVFVVLSCMQCFKRKAGFSNFNSSANTSNSGRGHVNTTFTLEISEADDDLANSTAVTIEPLPDIVSKAKMTPSVLRPRITCVERTRQDSALKLIAHHQFPRSQIVYLKELGSGWFGKVIESDAEKIVTGVPRSRVVVKMLKDDATKDEQQMFLEEVSPFRELEHPNILHLLGQCTDINPMLLVLESAAYGNLKQYLRSHRQHKATLIQKNRLLQFGIDAACGLACLHRHDYLHKDLAARNCLVMGDYTVKIGDYGIAEDLYQEDYLSCGNDLLPIRWMAPETLKQENGAWVAHNFSKESDIWSLGVLLWEITMMGERPYDMLTDEAVLQGVIVEKVIKLPEPDIGMAQKDRMYEVMQFCWLERSERTKVDEVHGLLQQVAVKSGTAPEGDISEFEKKWEHLMPNQRHSSVDSIDEDAAGRHTSLSSGDSDILNDLSGPDSLEDFLTVEAEPTPPVAPPRGVKKKVSASAVTIPGIAETPEPSPVPTKIKPARAAPPKPTTAPFTDSTPKPTPAAVNGDVTMTPSPAGDGKTESFAPQTPKSPSASEMDFTEFTSHDAADESAGDTPNKSAVSAMEDVFTTSDISVLEVETAEKAPAQNGVVEDAVLSAVPHARLENESFGMTTPNRPQPRDRKTSTPITKEETSSPSTSAGDSSSSATFLTAQTSSPGSVTGNYKTASDTTVFSEQDRTAPLEFSSFEELPTMPADNTESFVILSTSTAPPASPGKDQSQDSTVPEKKSEADQLDLTPTAAASPAPPAEVKPAVDRQDSFGEFTNASDENETDKPSPDKQMDDNAGGKGPPPSEVAEAPDSLTQSFTSFTDEFSLVTSEAPSSEATLNAEQVLPAAESMQEGDQFLSFGTDLSSLSSLTAAVPPPHTEEKEFPSFATDFSSMSSLDTSSAATPQAQQQDDPFGFGTEFVSADTPDPPKSVQGNLFTGSGDPSLGDIFSFDSLSSPAVKIGADRPDGSAAQNENAEIKSQEKDTESSKAAGGSGAQDLFGDFGVSSAPSQTSDSDGQSDPFGLNLTSDSGNQSGTQSSLTDLFGFGDSSSQVSITASVDTNIDIFDSKGFGQQDNNSSSLQPVGGSGEYDLLSEFSAPQLPLGNSQGPSNPDGDGGLLQDFHGPPEAAATKVGSSSSVEKSKSDNVSGTSGEGEGSSPCPTDTDSTTSDTSGKEYICEEPWPESSSSPDTADVDSEEYALRIASEIYLSKGLKLARPYESPPLEPIPEHPSPTEESAAPTPSETSSVDVRFEDVFEWDDFMGEPLVGKEQTSDGSPKQSFEMPDWSLDMDSESIRSCGSVQSFRSEDNVRGSVASETQSIPETTSAHSSLSDSEVILHGKNRTHRSYISDILSNRTKGLTINPVSPATRNTARNAQRQFYSLYEDDFDLEDDSHSEGSCSPPNPTVESQGDHLSMGETHFAVHPSDTRLPSIFNPSPAASVSEAHTNNQVRNG
ncbi:hypothetical protein BaRGS_00027739 [Batillaria attramentaria]|uniref:Protein kinase domain-containing protein n=1 Tax=Batillaria attramentaria TaxID=370345 RepID=A0ABD0K227_9CAEN